jgi:hypothetical protein
MGGFEDDEKKNEFFKQGKIWILKLLFLNLILGNSSQICSCLRE